MMTTTIRRSSDPRSIEHPPAIALIGTLTIVIVLAVCVVGSASAQGTGFQDPLLERLAGQWILTGTIDGQQTTHDLDIEWVLAHQYLRLYELAREKDSLGRPAYEAIVFFGWDEDSARYACLWLDVTGGGGLKGETIGHAHRNGNDLPFVFELQNGHAIHNTLSYDDTHDIWTETINVLADGTSHEFARVELHRKN